MQINKIFSLAILAGGLIFTSCSKGDVLGDNLPSGKLVSLKVPANYYSGNDISYFFVNSMDGELLHSQELIKSTSNVFEVNRIKNGSSPRYNFSRLYAYTSGSNKYLYIYTYIGMLPFSKEFTTTSSTSTYLGYASLKFTNVPAYTSFLLSSSYSYTTSGNLVTGTFNFSMYSDRPAGLFIRLNTTTGGFYKYVEGLVPGQTTTISLAAMINTFGSQNITSNSGNFTSSSITIDKYINNDFTSASYSVFSASTSGTPPTSNTVTYPSSFMSTNYTRLAYTGILTGATSTQKNSVNTFYSTAIPNNLNILDGTFSLTGKYPNRISYTMNVQNKVDALIIYFSHPSSFRSANSFGLSWIVYVSPSVREFQLPDVPANILDGITRQYGIQNLRLTELLPTSAYIYDNQKAHNFDEWMKNYWFGWGTPLSGQVDRYLYFNTSGNKKSSLSDDPAIEASPGERDRGY